MLVMGTALAVVLRSSPADSNRPLNPDTASVESGLGLDSVDVSGNCLCLFDIDRTLTGKQKGLRFRCPADELVDGAFDTAYGGGPLKFSDLKQHVLKTFCGKCYTGIVTAGQASGAHSVERSGLLEALGGRNRTLSEEWQDIAFAASPNVTSSLVLQSLDTSKQLAAQSMLDWFRGEHSVDIPKEEVYFFDDIADNVKAFHGTGMNAHQVSCSSRDPGGRIGGCGGVAAEVTRTKGVSVCPDRGL